MGSSLPTPTSSSQTSPVVRDGRSPVDNMYMSEENENPDELDDTSPSTRAQERPADAPDHTLGAPRVLKRLKGKERDLAIASKKKRPLQLLDLPVDILKEIIREVTHTNDLTSLALTHSALHDLTIPHIYSRFDIVWPDSHTTAEPRIGVDALTYGLATLVMGEETFEHGPLQFRNHTLPGSSTFYCPQCGAQNSFEMLAQSVRRPLSRRGNHYAQYTRKFSLGNGPPDWVQEYLITKEGGKMLGTLVALAVARMPNLETFTWDMPTGILRDVWLALSSLWDQRICRLERVWVRWHDNRSLSGAPPVPDSISQTHPPLPAGSTVPAAAAPSQTSTSGDSSTAADDLALSLKRVEHPTFSILPPLKSLNVLDIDELAYLFEMGILIGRSQHCLRELRVGIAPYAEKRSWVTNSTGDHDQVEGVLGTLMQDVHDVHQRRQDSRYVLPQRPVTQSVGPFVPSVPNIPLQTNASSSDIEEVGIAPDSSSLEIGAGPGPPDGQADDNAVDSLQHPRVSSTGNDASSPHESPCSLQHAENSTSERKDLGTLNKTLAAGLGPGTVQLDTPEESSMSVNAPLHTPLYDWKLASPTESAPPITARDHDSIPRSPMSLGKLKLEVLELERVPLTLPILQVAFDMATITSLTILHCPEHEQLWRSLRRTYLPRALTPASTTSRPKSISHSSPSQHTSSADSIQIGASEYRLKLKRLHTDAVSQSLVNFLKDALAPDSLEWLFLQEGRPYNSTVTISTICRGPLRRHKASLRKVMIESSDRTPDGRTAHNHRWKKWIFTREVLSFVTSGKMSSLRELGMAVDYRDWHFFLQRLPSIPHLRSLYIPFISNHVHPDPRELALQIVDIIALRPEVDICYLGISNKCFEVLENKHFDDRHPSHDTSTNAANAGPGGVVTEDHPDSDDDDDEDDEDEEEEEPNQDAAPTAAADPDGTESDASSDVNDVFDDDESDGTEEDKRRPRLRLREILFYDDKVSIFKARLGRL
ncbi:hypothetical protein MMC16_001821 [Acarospora aff. strigata]|nr:hypothetical protein [Acarospora aff. strigata]